MGQTFARRRGRWVTSTVTMTLAVAGAVAVVNAPAAHAAQTYNLPPSGSITVVGRGNGHGWGMSQWGAQGAALAGLSTAQILAFYYPGTALSTLAPSYIRVLLSGTGTDTTVAASPGLQVSGVGGTLPSAGVNRYRLVASGTGVELQRLTSTWATIQPGLPSGTFFSRGASAVRVYRTDGTSTAYRGTVIAVRSGAGIATVNRVSLDYYTAGVVPREMPASWEPAAVHAQAIAARTYGAESRVGSDAAAWDICDTTNCQVYGGAAHYDAANNQTWSEYLPAITGNENQVLLYNGAVAFTQFSASNGGYTAAGSKPYLVAKPDPYETPASGNPYVPWTKSVPVSRIASYYGLARVTSIVITQRDGNGSWGGRVLSGYVTGVDGSGQGKQIATDGPTLRAALGVFTNWFTISFSAAPIGRLDTATLTATNTYRLTGWVFDPDHSDLSTSVHVYVDRTRTVAQAINPRPDVQRVYHTASANLGYDVNVAVPNGSHRICVYGIDLDRVHHSLLKCVTVVVGRAAPAGRLDKLRRVSPRAYQVVGWTFDPDHPDRSTSVHIYVDRTRKAAAANLARPDVQRAYRIATPNVGFSAAVYAPPGKHRVCVYSIDLDRVHNKTLGCAIL